MKPLREAQHHKQTRNKEWFIYYKYTLDVGLSTFTTPPLGRSGKPLLSVKQTGEMYNHTQRKHKNQTNINKQ